METLTSELSKMVIENSDKGFNRSFGICRETLDICFTSEKAHKRQSFSLYE